LVNPFQHKFIWFIFNNYTTKGSFIVGWLRLWDPGYSHENSHHANNIYIYKQGWVWCLCTFWIFWCSDIYTDVVRCESTLAFLPTLVLKNGHSINYSSMTLLSFSSSTSHIAHISIYIYICLRQVVSVFLPIILIIAFSLFFISFVSTQISRFWIDFQKTLKRVTNFYLLTRMRYFYLEKKDRETIILICANCISSRHSMQNCNCTNSYKCVHSSFGVSGFKFRNS